MEKKVMIRNYGVSTDTYFMIDAHQVPRKGLDTVYLHYERLSLHNSFGYIPYCELEFCYEDGTHFPVKLKFVEEMDLEQLIRRYDDSVKIHRHRKMKEKDLLKVLALKSAQDFQALYDVIPDKKKLSVGQINFLWAGSSHSV